MIHFVLLISRQGKVRLTKWYSPYSSKEKARTVREVSAVVLSRQQKQCNFLEYKDKKVIYKRSVAPPHPTLRVRRKLSASLEHMWGRGGRVWLVGGGRFSALLPLCPGTRRSTFSLAWTRMTMSSSFSRRSITLWR